MAYSSFSIKTAEVFLETIAESSPGWRVILIAAIDLPQTEDHGAVLWVVHSYCIQPLSDLIDRVQPFAQEQLSPLHVSKLVEVYRTSLIKDLVQEGQ